MPKVIQGSFLSGQPKISPSIHATPPTPVPTRPATPGQTKRSRPPGSAGNCILWQGATSTVGQSAAQSYACTRSAGAGFSWASGGNAAIRRTWGGGVRDRASAAWAPYRVQKLDAIDLVLTVQGWRPLLLEKGREGPVHRWVGWGIATGFRARASLVAVNICMHSSCLCRGVAAPPAERAARAKASPFLSTAQLRTTSDSRAVPSSRYARTAGSVPTHR
jgi:hypothetical protein